MREVAVPDDRARDVLAVGRRAAKDRLHARDELARVERLRQVVVGADLEADDLVDVLVARGQHQDRHVGAAAQPPADLDPVDVGQHQVEDDQRRAAGPRLRQRVVAGRGHLHVVARVLEVERDERRDRGFVLDDEHFLRCVQRHSLQDARGVSYPGVGATRSKLVADVGQGVVRLVVERPDPVVEDLPLDIAGAVEDPSAAADRAHEDGSPIESDRERGRRSAGSGRSGPGRRSSSGS